ncbi:MAG: MptD family putative ECF transporter S component [Clostridia bacterium]|nr:MptD family putative ECF transporter S component [Clostridia bacterium]MDE6471446.1 MptD family putative ECF transporter S component [Clostridia bacterium]
MEEEKKDVKQNDIAELLIDNIKSIEEEQEAVAELAYIASVSENYNSANVKDATSGKVQGVHKNNRLFQKYKIKDMVFLAIITACTLVTGAVMPFVSGIQVFGIIQICLGLQFSILPVIGMMKVRKPGALLLQSIFISIFLSFMFPPMVSIILCALIAEVVALLIFRSYKNDWACVVAGTLYMPLTLPMLILLYNVFPSISKGKDAEQMFMVGSTNFGVAIGISVAVVAICFVGSVIGMVIMRELKKAGKLKE